MNAWHWVRIYFVINFFQWVFVKNINLTNSPTRTDCHDIPRFKEFTYILLSPFYNILIVYSVISSKGFHAISLNYARYAIDSLIVFNKIWFHLSRIFIVISEFTNFIWILTKNDVLASRKYWRMIIQVYSLFFPN